MINNNDYNAQNGSRGYTPAMVMPNGQVIFSGAPATSKIFRDQLPAETCRPESRGRQTADLIGLALAGALAVVAARTAMF